MLKNNPQFSREQLLALLRQPQTRALLERLQQLDPNALQQAAQKANQGDTQGAVSALQHLAQDETVQKLTEEMRNDHGRI